jgi:hypothetical protein
VPLKGTVDRVVAEHVIDGRQVQYREIVGILSDPNQTLIFKNKGSVACPDGNCPIKCKILASPYEEIFRGAGTFLFDLHTLEFITPMQFGAKADGNTDDTDAIQKAVQCVALSNGIGKVKFPGGIYKITKPIVVGKLVENRWHMFNITLEGMHPAFTDSWYGDVALILPEFEQGFAFGLQSCRSVFIKNLSIKGKSEYNFSLKQIFEDKDIDQESRSITDNRYSPYSAIVIDPFHLRTPRSGQYSGLQSNYIDAPGSSYVKIEGCKISHFDVGVAISPNGYSTQGDNISINDLHIDHCKYGIAICQSQSRSIQVNNISANNISVVFDAITFGAQQGQLPIVNVGSVSQIKWIYKCSNGLAYAQFRAIYGEEVYGLGYSTNPFGKLPISFHQCHITFTYPIKINTKGTLCNPALLQGYSASFDGCYLGYDVDVVKKAPLNFDVVNLSFNNCTLDVPITNSNLDKFAKNLNVIYNNITFEDSRTECTFSNNHLIQGISNADLNKVMLASGQLVVTKDDKIIEQKSQNPLFYEVEKGKNIVVYYDILKAKFTTNFQGLYSKGDAIYTSRPNSETGVGNTVRTCIGYVESVNGNEVTIEGITYGITDERVDIFVQRHPYCKSRALALTTSGSTSVNILSSDVSLGDIFNIGDKVNSNRLLLGTSVKEVGSNSLVLSHAANSGGITVLHDSNYSITAKMSDIPSSGIWMKGDVVFNNFVSNSEIEKWICVEDGAFNTSYPPKFKAVKLQ